MQLQQRGTLTQPFHCDLQTLSCETQENGNTRLQRFPAPKPDLDAKAEQRRFLKRFSKGILKGKSSLPESKKNLLPKHHSHVSRCHYNMIYDSAAKRNSNAHAAAATRALDAAIPLRSADTVLQHTIESQHTTVEHIL